MENIVPLLTSTAAVLTGVIGILKYFQYRSRRDEVALVRQSFDGVVKSLASEVEVERMAAAILLRRFFDPDTEVGVAGTPYWKESVNVTAAILRGLPAGNFQKLLADGLSFAPSLTRADLQRTNLQFAYLGARKVSDASDGQINTDLSHADFYRADLSKASLKGATARGAIFYQARMHGTVVSDADLRDANFFEADLKGARFDRAFLNGAVFAGALNIPASVLNGLDVNGIYRRADRLERSKPATDVEQISVFLSKPGFLDYRQEQQVQSLRSRLDNEGLVPKALDRTDYPRFGAMAEIQRLIAGCSGAVIIGFKQLEVRDGVWRPGTREEKPVKDQLFATPWNHVEAGMAAMLSLPILLVCERGIEGGVFDVESDRQIYRLFLEDDWKASSSLAILDSWCADVRDRSRS